MKKFIFILSILLMAAAPAEPLTRHKDGSVSVNTSTLKTVEGCFGPTPVVIQLDAKGVVTAIESLPNTETPSYWQAVTEALVKRFVGVPAREIPGMEVDAVTGATYSSEGLISNVRAGINLYLESSRK